MRGLPGDARIAQPRSMLAGFIAHKRADGRLIECNPVMHPVTQAARYNIGVAGESLCRFPARPATHFILQRLWQIPMIERYKRLDIRGQQAIYKPVIKIQASGSEL